MTALDRWRDQLDAWAIPEAIVAAAPEPPWGFPVETFRRRGQASAIVRTTTTRRALEALPPGGSVLDVGVGGGATSLPLARWAGVIIGLDGQADMLHGFLANASAAGVQAEAVEGRWPFAADRVAHVDIVMAGHVLYNVADLGPFIRALDEHARSRIVLELTDRHPLDWMRDLWRGFHDLDRPTGPTATDAVDAIAELGFDVRREDHETSDLGSFARREDAVALVRRRLCLPADRDDEIANALGDRLHPADDGWDIGPRERTIVTLWWDAGR